MSDAASISNPFTRPRRERRSARPWRIDLTLDYDSVANRWAAMAREGGALAFQGETWLKSWYESFARSGDATPILVTLSNGREGGDAIALPLVRRRVDGLSVIEFADGGLTDYNAPIIGPGAPRDVAGAQGLWASLRANLPRGDILRLEKMPRAVGGKVNPLALVKGVRPSRLNGNILRVDGDWSDWNRGLERAFRKELERCLRVFEKHPGARFERLRDPERATAIFAELKRLQAIRIRELGLPYVLDEPANESFYDDVLARGLARGDTILTALTTGDEVVAALLGIARGDHYSMVRLATAGPEWKTCSPGRLIIERTMKTLHAEGFRTFDFTIGDYAYKRRLGASPAPLCELETALSWRGVPSVTAKNARAFVRADPCLMKLAARLRRE